MEQVQEERFVFAVEWFDKQADLIRNYLLTFYPKDNTIDMVSHFSLMTRGFLPSILISTI